MKTELYGASSDVLDGFNKMNRKYRGYLMLAFISEHADIAQKQDNMKEQKAMCSMAE